jgi:hypothetical protein
MKIVITHGAKVIKLTSDCEMGLLFDTIFSFGDDITLMLGWGYIHMIEILMSYWKVFDSMMKRNCFSFFLLYVNKNKY